MIIILIGGSLFCLGYGICFYILSKKVVKNIETVTKQVAVPTEVIKYMDQTDLVIKELENMLAKHPQLDKKHLKKLVDTYKSK